MLLAPAALAFPNAMHPELGATLLGKNEVPKGSPTAHGIVNVTLNSSKRTVCWTFELAGVTKPAFAHIHKGRAGVSGPIASRWARPTRPRGVCGAEEIVDAVESNPNGYYVNVHNAKYPNGVVRGELVAGMVHM